MITPLGARVLVALCTTDEKSPGGIIIPETALATKPIVAEVIAAGPGYVLNYQREVPAHLQHADAGNPAYLPLEVWPGKRVLLRPGFDTRQGTDTCEVELSEKRKGYIVSIIEIIARLDD